MRRLLLLLPLLVVFAPTYAGDAPGALAHWPEAARTKQLALEGILQVVPNADRLRAWHDLFCAEAHPAGTPGDTNTIEKMVKAFRDMGLETYRDDMWVYLPHFESAQVAVEVGDQVFPLSLRERPLPEDPHVAESVPAAFNAYSASGQARGEVVYANYGTREDFKRLEALGISCKGKVVIARYGKNYRGFKAKFAEAAGAAGLLMYTDPADSGWGRGLPYPEGGFANESYIQRGSIKTLAYPGDPLTPGAPATKDAERLDPATVALPKIPVQPIGWAAAAKILERMDGASVPAKWQGGLPFRYRLTSRVMKVRLAVQQPRRIMRTSNVIGMIRGAKFPDQKVVIGCHLDAWTFGAGDPHAGSIVLYEMARSFADAARAGQRPDRTIVFANWGAEEFGIIGSTEWCESHHDDLLANGIAYVNLDMAAMGKNFRSAAAPLLKDAIQDAAAAVAHGEGSVLDDWTARGKGKPGFGNLGGGSDHVGFYLHLGIPSCSLGGGGSQGVSYHSAYDTVTWYRKVVGEDYAAAKMVAQVGNVLVARLANAPLLPFHPARYAVDMRAHLAALAKGKGGEALAKATTDLSARLDSFEKDARAVRSALEKAVADGTCTGESLAGANAVLLGLERAWLLPKGLPGRPWYRNAFATTDPYSGYAAWMLPLFHHAVEGDANQTMEMAAAVYSHLLKGLEQKLQLLKAAATAGN